MCISNKITRIYPDENGMSINYHTQKSRTLQCNGTNNKQRKLTEWNSEKSYFYLESIHCCVCMCVGAVAATWQQLLEFSILFLSVLFFLFLLPFRSLCFMFAKNCRGCNAMRYINSIVLKIYMHFMNFRVCFLMCSYFTMISLPNTGMNVYMMQQ